MDSDKVSNRADVDQLKQMLIHGWNRILKVPDERIYAFGIYTNESAQSMSVFALGEKGLERVARKYVEKGVLFGGIGRRESALVNSRFTLRICSVQKCAHIQRSAECLRSTHNCSGSRSALSSHHRVHGTAGTGRSRSVQQRWPAGPDHAVYRRRRCSPRVDSEVGETAQLAVGLRAICEDRCAPPTPLGTFTEAGTKKVYNTVQYAQSADRRLLVAATHYHTCLASTRPS